MLDSPILLGQPPQIIQFRHSNLSEVDFLQINMVFILFKMLNYINHCHYWGVELLEENISQ